MENTDNLQVLFFSFYNKLQWNEVQERQTRLMFKCYQLARNQIESILPKAIYWKMFRAICPL